MGPSFLNVSRRTAFYRISPYMKDQPRNLHQIITAQMDGKI